MFGFFEKKKISLSEITKKLNALRIPVALRITPINLEEEKEKFFESDTYNPQFKYKLERNNNDNILKELLKIDEISDVDPRISQFYIKLIKDKDEVNDLIKAVGNNKKFTEISKKRFGKPSIQLFKTASLILKRKVYKYSLSENRGKPEELSPSEIINAFKVVFKELGLDDWSVEHSKNIAENGIKTGVKIKKVFLDPNIFRTKVSLRKTMIHEIGTHALRAHNGYLSGFDALGKANVKSYLPVEEGLALYNEEYFGYLTYENLRKRALMTYGIYVGEELSFRKIYNIFLGFVPRLEAFDIAYRIKRGLSDTSLPGIYSKDLVYLKGFKKMKREIQKDKSLYENLYAGKIDLKMVDWVREGLIPKPKIVPNKEMFNRAFIKAGI